MVFSGGHRIYYYVSAEGHPPFSLSISKLSKQASIVAAPSVDSRKNGHAIVAFATVFLCIQTSFVRLP